MTAWRPIGLALHERHSSEVTCETCAVRAVVRVSRLRVGVDFTPIPPGATAHLPLAAAHRLAATALEQAAGSEGWLVAVPSIYPITGGARVVISGAGAAVAAAAFFGPRVDAALRRPRRPRQLALGTLTGAS